MPDIVHILGLGEPGDAMLGGYPASNSHVLSFGHGMCSSEIGGSESDVVGMALMRGSSQCRL